MSSSDGSVAGASRPDSSRRVALAERLRRELQQPAPAVPGEANEPAAYESGRVRVDRKRGELTAAEEIGPNGPGGVQCHVNTLVALQA